MISSSSLLSYFGGVGRALSVRDYRIYWIGQAVSVQGVWIHRISAGVLTFQLTQSPGWLGFIAFIYFVPLILVGPIAGAFADRIGHRRTAIGSLSVAVIVSLTMAGLTFAGLMNPYLLAALIVVLGIGHAFDFPARQVLIQILVGRERMSAAIALNTTTFNTAAFTGPVIGAALLAFGKTQFGDAGPAVGFVVYALVSIWFMISLIRIRARDAAAKQTSVMRLLADVKECLAYTARHETIRTLIVMWIVASFLTRAYLDLLPGFAEEVFQRGEAGLGTLFAASGGGALVLSVIMAVRGRTQGMPRLFIASVTIAAIAVVVFAATPSFWVATGAMVFAGGFIVTAAISAQTLVQATVDPVFRGRVLAVYLSTVPSAQAVGSFAIGWVAEFTGLPLAVGGGGALAFLMMVLWGPRVWRRARAIEAEATNPPHGTAAPATKAAE